MNATIHIRISDEEKWRAIPNKSEFIHNALNPTFDIPEQELAKLKVGAVVSGRPIKTRQDAAKVVKEVFPDAKPVPSVIYKKTSNWGA